MSVAWTTLFVIALLLPGVFFLMGMSARERYSKEIIKTTGVGELGVAVAIAIVLHLGAWEILSLFGFQLDYFLLPLAMYGNLHTLQIIQFPFKTCGAAASILRSFLQ